MKNQTITLLFLMLCFLNLQTLNSDWAQETLKSMSTREKIGQLFMVATASNFDQPEEALASALVQCPYKMDQEHIEHLIKEYHVGGLIFLFKSTPGIQIDKTNYYQALSKLPLLIGQDSEWGLSMRLYETVRFPRNMTLGAIHDKNLIYELGKEIGTQCAAIGVHINFAPVVDVNNNPENPVINDRSFGENKELVAADGERMMCGMQDAGIIACAKHFPGHGDTKTDSHHELPTILHAREHLELIELYPFKKLIKAGVQAVMNAHLAIPALDDTPNLPSSLSHNIVTDILKKELGFNGLVITDGLGMKAITDHNRTGEAELKAVLAGNDIILCPVNVPEAVILIEQALATKQLSYEELDAHVLKILQAKQQQALQDNRFIEKETALQNLTTAYSYALKKKLYRAALTLVHNKNNILPLTPHILNGALLQIGGSKNSMFEQSLGYLGLKNFYLNAQSSPTDTTNTLEQLAPYKTIIVGVFDMNKFASKNYGLSQETRTLITHLSDRKKTVILALFGSPYSLKFFDKQDAIIMAYEDDPDAQEAAADVITGKLTASGMLPITAS